MHKESEYAGNCIIHIMEKRNISEFMYQNFIKNLILSCIMYNLKDIGGTYKGLIGEFMFKSTRKWSVLMKCWNNEKYFRTFGKYFNSSQIHFIQQNWHSHDCLEIFFNNGKKELRMYEIKTKNENKRLHYKPKITQSTLILYQEAEKIGFHVYLAQVVLKEVWNFDTHLERFAPELFVLDKPKLYDKKIKNRY